MREHNSQPVQTTAPPTSCSKSLVLHFQVSVDTSLTDSGHNNSNGVSLQMASRLGCGGAALPALPRSPVMVACTHTHLTASAHTNTDTGTHVPDSQSFSLFVPHLVGVIVSPQEVCAKLMVACRHQPPTALLSPCAECDEPKGNLSCV